MCIILPLSASVATKVDAYLWYPGQLAAYMQERQKAISKARCINVDYPGRFFCPVTKTWFKTSINLRTNCTLRFRSSGRATVYVDGNISKSSIPSGKHSIIIKVVTDSCLPTVRISNTELCAPSIWKTSLDGKTWNPAESSQEAWIDKVLDPLPGAMGSAETTVPVKASSAVVLRQCDISTSADNSLKLNFCSNGAVLIDFNTLEIGNVSFIANGNGTLHFTAGETQEEAMNENQRYNEQIELPTIKLNGGEQHITLPVYALRYLKIRATGSCKVDDVVFNTLMWPVHSQLTFKCSDERMNRMFNAGIATLKTSLHNFYLDGVKRDFLPWAMDAMVSSLGANYAFGDQQVTRNCISIALMRPSPTADDFGVVDYPLHALIGLQGEYLRYGDINTSLMFRDRIEQQMALYEKCLNGKGFIESKQPTWGFIPGWNLKNGPEKFGVASYAQMLLYINFKIAADFENLWGDKKAADHYIRCAARLGHAIMSTFWDEKRHAFVNGYNKKEELDTRISHQAQIAGVLAGLYPEKYYDTLFEDILPHLPYYYTDVSYEKGYDALAYVKAGKVQQLYTLLDKVWGHWLDEGYIRYPENFSIGAPMSQQLSFYGRPFGLSQCHGANGVPPVIAALRGIIGFSEDSQNRGQYTFKPSLLTMSFAEGTIPVREGEINVHFSKDGQSSVSVPARCKVTVLYKGRRMTFHKGLHFFK